MPHTLASSSKFLQKLERGILHAECLSPCMRNWKPSTRKERRHCIEHAALKKVLFAVSRSRGGCVDHIEVVIGRGSQAPPLFCACQRLPKLILHFLSPLRIKINTILFWKTPDMSKVDFLARSSAEVVPSVTVQTAARHCDTEPRYLKHINVDTSCR